MKCPICKANVELGAADFPFCSARCRLLDLGKWASEEYRIPVSGPKPIEEQPTEDDED
jgi:hypothetical protein